MSEGRPASQEEEEPARRAPRTNLCKYHPHALFCKNKTAFTEGQAVFDNFRHYNFTTFFELKCGDFAAIFRHPKTGLKPAPHRHSRRAFDLVIFVVSARSAWP